MSEELRKVVRELADAGNTAADKAQESGLSGDDLMEAGISAATDYLENYLNTRAPYPALGDAVERISKRVIKELYAHEASAGEIAMVSRIIREELSQQKSRSRASVPDRLPYAQYRKNYG
jgi:hypothetical protein